MAPGDVPAFSELIASPAWQTIDFISDLHLAPDTPRGFEAWATYLSSTPADAVFILGDLFEVWLGDDSRHTGFEARCAAMLTAASAVRHVAFMVGNRDFLLGLEMLSACGVAPLADPTVLVAFGQRLLLSHGDALCLADLDYQRLRRTVREPRWQAGVLAQSLEIRRVLAHQMREQSRHHQLNQAPGAWFDIDRDAALQWMRAARTPELVHGHTHHAGSEVLAPGFTRHVLSDWDVDHAEPPRADVLRWQRGTLTRLTPESATSGV